MASSGNISSSLANLVNGVSQQPFTLRLDSQAEAQENGLSTVSNGLLKRPGSVHIAKIDSSPTTNAYIHVINRDKLEKYVVVITNGNLKVFDTDGVQKTVTFPDGTSYLSTATPNTSFIAQTIEDYTFIANKEVTVLASTTLHPSRDPEAVINVKAGNYAKGYSIQKNGTQVAAITTPNGTSPSDATWIDTTTIAGGLRGAGYTTVNGAAITNTFSGSGITVTQLANLIYHTSVTDFSITVSDGVNGNAMDVVKGDVQRFSDLPKGGVVSGFTVKVKGSTESNEDDYYVKWVPNGTNSTNGVWRETVKPGTPVGLDAPTMPHILVRNSDGTFTFKRATWDQRTVGDIDSNPDPSFVGNTVSGLFFTKNRLGILSKDASIHSEASEFFNFFRTTVRTLLDSDPIDAAAAHTKPADLFAGIPSNRKLILFSGLTQFVESGSPILTPKSVAIDPSTEYECDTGCLPVSMGKYIYFTVPRGKFSGIREYFTDADTAVEDAPEITGHIQKYLPSGIFKIAAASNESTLVFSSRETLNILYVWRTYEDKDKRLQNSWSKWIFPTGDSLLYADFISSVLFVVISRSDGTYLEKIDISIGSKEDLDPYSIKMDRSVTRTFANMTYSGGKTIITMPYLDTSETYQAVVDTSGSNTLPPGTVLKCVWNVSTGKLEISGGNYTTESLTVGRKVPFRYELSPITYKQTTQNGSIKSDTQARLQIRRISINYESTGFFQVRVTPKGRDPYIYTYTGKTLGDESTTLGAISLGTGKFSVPIGCKNTEVKIEILSDEPLPLALMSINWEGHYVKRSKSV